MKRLWMGICLIIKSVYQKIYNYMKRKCPNCDTYLTESVYIDNTIKLDCEKCKYHEEYNDSYP